MKSQVREAMGLYLYAIVMASEAIELGPVGLEVGGQAGDVFPIVVGDVAAIVSHFPAGKRVMPMRRNLDAQNKVLRALNERPSGLVPLRFGHVVPNEKALTRLLLDRQGELVRTLAHLCGRTEMALAVSWEVPNIFDHTMKCDVDLLALRDQLFAEGREPTRAERIELGHRFASHLEEERKVHTKRVRDAMKGDVIAVVEDPVTAEKDIMRLALLVERSRRSQLEERIGVIACEFPDSVTFTFTGPFAPFHFVGLDLDDEDEGEEAPEGSIADLRRRAS